MNLFVLLVSAAVGAAVGLWYYGLQRIAESKYLERFADRFKPQNGGMSHSLYELAMLVFTLPVVVLPFVATLWLPLRIASTLSGTRGEFDWAAPVLALLALGLTYRYLSSRTARQVAAG